MKKNSIKKQDDYELREEYDLSKMPVLSKGRFDSKRRGWNDPIVEEVRKVRNEHAKKFGYDLRAIVADLKKQQQASKRKTVSFPPKKPVVLPKVKAER
jgi:hypothetical protein